MKKSITTLTLFVAPLVTVPAVALAATAADNWTEYCARCHGADGSANTKVGKKLKLKDYSSAKVQAEMTDEEIQKAIAEGVFDENKKEKMPAYKDKMSEKEIKDMIAHVRSLKK